MAIDNGLTSAIANPFDGELMGQVRASDVLLARDYNSAGYISFYSGNEKDKTGAGKAKPDSEEKTLTTGGKAVQGDIKRE